MGIGPDPGAFARVRLDQPDSGEPLSRFVDRGKADVKFDRQRLLSWQELAWLNLARHNPVAETFSHLIDKRHTFGALNQHRCMTDISFSYG